MEQFESLEEKLIRLLKQKRPEESAEVRAALDVWTNEQEKIVATFKDWRPALRRARLYFKAGYRDESLEAFEDAREQAYHQEGPESEKKIMKEMNDLGF